MWTCRDAKTDETLAQSGRDKETRSRKVLKRRIWSRLVSIQSHITMLFYSVFVSALAAIGAVASPFGSSSDSGLAKRENHGIQYLGSQSATLSGGTRFGDLVFVSGQVPLINGTVVPGGIRNETAFVIERVGEILKEGGTDWSKVLKVTVLLQGQSRALDSLSDADIRYPRLARVE